MSQYVAAYDVSNDRQRDRVARVLCEYGERVQKSVFVLWLDTNDLAELRRSVGSLLAAEDKFDLFPVDTRPGRPLLTWQRRSQWTAPVIVVDGTV